MKFFRCLVFVPALASAQPLEAFVDSSLRHNIDGRLSDESVRKAQIERAEAWSALLPSATLTGGYTYNQFKAEVQVPRGPTEPAQTIVVVPQNQLDGAVKLELALLDLSKWTQIGLSGAGVDAAESKRQQTIEATRREIAASYYALASAARLVEAATRSLELADAQEKQIVARKAAGVATDLDGFRAQAEIQRNAQILADAKGVLANAKHTLESQSGLRVDTVPQMPTDSLVTEQPVEVFWSRLDQVASILAAESEVAVAAAQTRSAWAQTAPIVSAQFTQRLTNATGFQNSAALYNAGIGLNWRLDVATFQRLRARDSGERTASLLVEKARVRARDQVFQDWQRVTVSIEKVKAAGSQKDAALRAVSLAKERYTAGVATQVDVIQTERDLFSAQVAEIQSRFELASARALLRIDSGLSIASEAS